MARGTYLHTLGRGPVCYDGVPEGSSVKVFACESRELGGRAMFAIHEENEGDRLDRFLEVTARARNVRKPGRR